MSFKILIVDDEIGILNILKRYFELNNYQVITSKDAATTFILLSQNPDIIILDINLPDINGYSICEKIRKYITCPIIFLSAYDEEQDKIKGFISGGDDYITKPFSIDELGARVAAHLRREIRISSTNKQIIYVNGLVINYTERTVYFKDNIIYLLKREFDIVEVLSQNPGHIFDKERLYEIIWGIESTGNNSVIAEHIRKIRLKFSTASCKKQFIETVWGIGYKWIN